MTFLLVDMLRQRQLNDEAIDILFFVEAVNTSQQLFLRHVILIADERRGKTALLAGDNLVFHVRLRAAVMSYEDSGQMRTFATSGDNLAHFVGNFGLDGRCSSFTVNQFHMVRCCYGNTVARPALPKVWATDGLASPRL